MSITELELIGIQSELKERLLPYLLSNRGIDLTWKIFVGGAVRECSIFCTYECVFYRLYSTDFNLKVDTIADISISLGVLLRDILTLGTNTAKIKAYLNSLYRVLDKTIKVREVWCQI